MNLPEVHVRGLDKEPRKAQRFLSKSVPIDFYNGTSNEHQQVLGSEGGLILAVPNRRPKYSREHKQCVSVLGVPEKDGDDYLDHLCPGYGASEEADYLEQNRRLLGEAYDRRIKTLQDQTGSTVAQLLLGGSTLYSDQHAGRYVDSMLILQSILAPIVGEENVHILLGPEEKSGTQHIYWDQESGVTVFRTHPDRAEKDLTFKNLKERVMDWRIQLKVAA